MYLLGDLEDAEPGNIVRVKLLGDGVVIEVAREDVFAANPDGLTCPDNTMLIHLSEATLLANVRGRYVKREIYTLTGQILLAMNPFEALPIYCESIMAGYKDKVLGRGPPHVYGIAETAYKMLIKTTKSQSIVVSGESGAGKTETNKHLMYYLAWRSKASGGTATLAECILQSNPVLEAFGNAKTSRNNNSSRFGKFIKILIGNGGSITGAKMASYLLEKSRVVSVAEGERNYHALYHVGAGAPADLVKHLGLGCGPKGFHYLNQSSVTQLALMDDSAMFQELVNALRVVGVSAAEQHDIWACLAGILHIGNLTFAGDEAASITSAESIGLVKATMATDLAACLTTRSMTVGAEKTVVPLTPEKAVAAREALAKATYIRLFDWLVTAVNRSLASQEGDRGTAVGGGPETAKFVGLLDVFGFEFFGTNNSFEQLAINFANEKLQQFFLKFVFKAEENEYAAEAVRYTPIEYQDNQGCIDLVEKTPSGILRVLDTQCKTPKATDETFSLQVNKEHKKNDFFLVPRAAGLRKFKEEDAFVVRHFAGNVCYMSAGFMDKNNDTLNPDFESALFASTNSLLSTLFAPDGSGKKRNASFNSVGRRFINDLDSLMTDLGATHAHFIRCLKPNIRLQPQQFSATLILSQLRCSGTLEAVQLISASYPTRIPYDDVYGRYKDHMPDFVQGLEASYFTEAIALACDVSEDDYQLGRSKIFLRPGKGAFLEELKDRDLSEVIPILVAKIKEWELKRAARALLARRVGGWMFRQLFLKKRGAVQKLQHQHRTLKVHRAYRVAQAERAKHVEERKIKLAAEKVAKERAEAEAKIAAAKDAAERARLEAEEREAEKQRLAEAEEAKQRASAEADKLQAERDAAAAEARAAKAARAAERATSGTGTGDVRSGGPKKKGAALLMATSSTAGRKLGAPKAEGPPTKVKEDTEFLATIQRDRDGLGIEVDQVESRAVIGAVAPRGAASKQSAIRPGDVVTKVFEYDTPTYDSVIASIRGASGGPLQLTMLRRPITKLLSLYSGIDQKVGMGKQTTWRPVSIEVFSNRDVKYSNKEGAGSGLIPMREAFELQLIDHPGGSGTLAIVTQKQTYELRAREGSQLHTLQRKLVPLFPQLGLSIRKEGWLQKKAETGSHFAKRWCVLDSAFKLHYFKDPHAEKEQGNVDLAVATGVSDAKGGLGFEITTPGRVWVFNTDSRDTQAEWMAAITAMMNDLREANKEREAAGGSLILKASEAAMCNDVTGDWRERVWWELSSAGILTILESEGGQPLHTVKLEDVSKVDRTKGEDFYRYCLDIDVEAGPEDFTLTMRPNGRHDMTSWLAILTEQVQKHAKQINLGAGGSVSISQTGWVALRRADVNGDIQAIDDAGRVYAVLVTEQKEVAQAISVTHTLYWFPTESASTDLGNGTAFDLEEVEALSAKADGAIVLVTDSSWQLEVKADVKLAEWLSALKAHCVNAEGYESPLEKVADLKDTTGGNVVLARKLRMIVPRTGHPNLQGAAGVWQVFACELNSKGVLSFKHQPSASKSFKTLSTGWESGSIDLAKAIGVWLLGRDSSSTLDIIMAGKKHTLACEESEGTARQTLEDWKRAIEAMMPHKPTQELHRGWLEKQGEVGNAWKMRFFVLLSTRKLLYFESDASSKQRGQIDLQTATHVRPTPDEFYNYEDAIEVVTAKRRWILCPESRNDKEEWIAALLPMIGGESATDVPDAQLERIETGGFVSQAAAKRVSRISITGCHRTSMVVAQDEAKRGWLERQEDGGEWSRRYFVLETRKREGASEASIEYYLDEHLAIDEDSEAIHLMPGTTARQGAPDGARQHILQVDSAGGTRLIFAAASSSECLEWLQAIRSAVDVRCTSANLSELASASAQLHSTRSEVTSSILSRGIPEEGLKVHEGWLTKKGEGIMAKSQLRWFALYRNAEMHYFDNEAMGIKNHKGVVVLAGVKPHHISRLKPGTYDYSFSIVTPKRKWQLKTASQTEYDAWHSALMRIVGAS